MSELNEFTEELKEFILERIAEIEERNEDIAAQKAKDVAETLIAKLITETATLSGEIKAYTEIYVFMNEKGLV